MPYGKYKSPNPNILGTGSASKAGHAMKKRNTRTQTRMNSIMGEIQNTRGGTQNFKKFK